MRISDWSSDVCSSDLEYQSTATGADDMPGAELTAAQAPRYFAALDASLTLAAEDALSDARTADLVDSYLQPAGIGALLDVAVRQGGQMIGVVCHEHIGGARTWASEERLFVTAEIGRATCRERVCPYVKISVVDV